MLLGLHTYSLYLHGIGQAWADFNRINIETEMDIPLDDMETALRMEKQTIEQSINYCRAVLGITKGSKR